MNEAAGQARRSRLVGNMLDEHGAALAMFAAQWTSAADDCVQEALIELAALTSVPDRPVAWLYCVVKRRALNHARGERRRTTHEQSAWRHRLTHAARSSHESSLELADALAQLDAADREVVVLKTWGRLTFVEIAEVTGESSSSAHRRYTHALSLLREHWGLSCPAPNPHP